MVRGVNMSWIGCLRDLSERKDVDIRQKLISYREGYSRGDNMSVVMSLKGKGTAKEIREKGLIGTMKEISIMDNEVQK